MEIKTMDDDLFRRICRKQCVPTSDDELEIFDDASDEHIEEEELPIEPSEEPFDLNAWSKELECMKRRIQMLQLRLKQKLDECPEEPCVDIEVELTCSENKEICNLQKDQSKLQYQINELIRCMKFAKDQIKDLRIRMCEKSKDILQLQKVVARLESWRKTLDREFGICIERFNYLKHVKAEWKDVLEELQKYKNCCAKFEKLFVPKDCYMRDKQLFTEETDNLREIFKYLCLLQTERFSELDARISNIEARLPKEAEKEKKPAQFNEIDDIELLLRNHAKPMDAGLHPNKIYFGVKELFPKKCGNY